MMKTSIVSIAALAGLAILPTTAISATFEFNLTDWSDGGVLTGSFEAEDLNGDGQIVQFGGIGGDTADFAEVTAFSASYQSGQLGGPIEFDESAFFGEFNLTGLVYNLDGLGTIGDSTFGSIEGLGIDSNDGQYYLAVGPGPVALCDGFQDCGILQENDFGEVEESEESQEFFGTILATNDQSIQVTSGPLGEFSGEFEENALLPDEIDENGRFVFDIDGNIVGTQIFFIDPEIAVGYTYEIDGSEFTAVQAPSLNAVADGDGMYTLMFGTEMVTLLPGEIYTFTDSVTSFKITGIDEALMLDPTDTTAFVTGVSIESTSGSVTVTQAPITINTDPTIAPVPLPASSLLLLGGLAGLFGLRRRVSG